MTSPICAKVLLHVWSYDFMTLSYPLTNSYVINIHVMKLADRDRRFKIISTENLGGVLYKRFLRFILIK